MKVLCWLSLAWLFYIYAGYPLVIALLVRLRGARPVRRRDITPPVSFVISAYNEAGVIRTKLENTLRLDYPAAALEVVVISDASSDGTDEIVAEYADRGVALQRQAERRGKTVGLNRVVPTLGGKIIVFSDANAMYEPDALRKLVRNFADCEVGCVTGEARYVSGVQTAADVGERVYWNYEIHLKRLETAIGSTVGGDGAIYAIRKELWSELPETAINDFLNPLQIVAAGWRAIYEPEAICFEETAGGIGREYRRRVRIISRSWRAIFQAPGALNPFRVGFFTISVISHKLLRWLSALFVAGALVGLAGVVSGAGMTMQIALLALATLLAGAIAAIPAVRRFASLGLYFAVINVASLVGVIKGTVGRVSGTWATPREADARWPLGRRIGRVVAASWPVLLGLILLAGIGGLAALLIADLRASALGLFWASAAMLVYVYLGYPLALALLRRLVPRQIGKRPIEPVVCLFITANDEEAVIEAKLRNSLELDYPKDRLRIVVASDGSVDGTNAIVRSFATRGVRLIEFKERRGKIAAINAGVPLVSGEVIVFSDANAFLDRGAVRALVRSFADPSVGVASGDVVLVGDRAALGASEDLYYRYERWLQRVESEIGSMVGVDGALYAIRRRLFAPPPDDTILDDLAIPMAAVRAGYRAVFEPDALASEQGSRSAREEFARKSRIIAGAVQFLVRSPRWVSADNLQVLFSLISHKVLRWLSPSFAVAAFAASAVLAPESGIYLAATIAQATFLSAGVAGCSPRIRRLRLIGIAHYFCLVHAAAAVGLVRGLLGRQPATWRRFQRAPVEAA